MPSLRERLAASFGRSRTSSGQIGRRRSGSARNSREKRKNEINIVVIGDGMAGKTALVTRLINPNNKSILSDYNPTIFEDYNHTMMVDNDYVS